MVSPDLAERENTSHAEKVVSSKVAMEEIESRGESFGGDFKGGDRDRKPQGEFRGGRDSRGPREFKGNREPRIPKKEGE